MPRIVVTVLRRLVLVASCAPPLLSFTVVQPFGKHLVLTFVDVLAYVRVPTSLFFGHF